MKITSIETIRVTIPLEAPILWSQGYRSATTRTLVKIHTDEGITGIGETRGDDGIEEMIQSIAAKLKGEDPFQIELVLEKFHMLGYFHGYFGLSAIAGVEIALWDIVGKATKQPLFNLLGGRYRDPVPFSGYIFYRSRTEDGKGGEQSPEEIVAFCDVDSTCIDVALAKFQEMGGDPSKVRRYSDWRKMLEREERNLDAITVTTLGESLGLASAIRLVGMSTPTTPSATAKGHTDASHKAPVK